MRFETITLKVAQRRKEKSSVHRILSTTNNEEFEVENGALKETGEEMEKPER